MINSLKYVKQLEEAGLTREQAETHMQIITEVMETNLATKQDIRDTKQDLQDVKQGIQQEIRDLENKSELRFQSLENKIIQSEYRLTIKLGTIVSIALGLAVTLGKLF